MPPPPQANEPAQPDCGYQHGLRHTGGAAPPMKEEFLAFTVLRDVSCLIMKEEFLTCWTSSRCFTVWH